jgi:hypothetical protein
MEDKPRISRGQMNGLMFMAMTFGGIMIALAGKMMELKWLTFTGVFIAIGGMFLIAAYSLVSQSFQRKRKPAAPIQSVAEIERADTTNKLPPISENGFIPSVVEDTTDLLATPASRGSASRE